MKRIAVLMTCHNRKEKSLRCLRSLWRAAEKNGEDWHIFLVDDGSVDGTSEVVRSAAEQAGELERLHMIQGDGRLFWAKGMELAWQMALADESIHGKFDGYLWLNDDTKLNAGALELMLSGDDDSMMIGDLVDAAGQRVYGLNVNGWVNGNCVLVPRRIYERVGMICGQYAHAWADSDYAIRVKRAGFAIVGAGVVGETEWHTLRPALEGKTLGERWRLLFDPKGWNLHDLWLYRVRNWGSFRALLSCIHLIFHVLRG